MQLVATLLPVLVLLTLLGEFLKMVDSCLGFIFLKLETVNTTSDSVFYFYLVLVFLVQLLFLVVVLHV